MSKIVFFNIPAHGHTNPTLDVVKELVSRGHQVWYYSYDFLKEKIESVGAVFISCDNYDAEYKLSKKDSARLGSDLAFSTKILVDTTLALDDKICREIEQLQPDCIVADSMALWGKAVAIKLGIPFVSSTTTFAFNKYSAKILKQSFFDLIKMFFWAGKISKQVNRLKEKGYPINNILDIIGNDENAHTIVYTSHQFQPYSETFSEKFSFVGPSVRQSEEKFDKNKNKLVYISMGTVNNDMLSFYKTCLAAFLNTDYQVVISVGDKVSVNDFGEIPENVQVFSHVDQIAVLEKADVFISHCGMNSVSESLYFGVPLMMVPQTTEQKGVAERVLELGAGIKLDCINSASVIKSVERLLCDKSYKQNAELISDNFRKYDCAKLAADKIISVCK